MVGSGESPQDGRERHRKAYLRREMQGGLDRVPDTAAAVTHVRASLTGQMEKRTLRLDTDVSVP